MLILKAVVLPIAFLVHCSAVDGVPGGHQYGIGAGGSSWTTNAEDSVLGVDAASVSKITLYAGPPPGVTFVVWSDLPHHRSGNGGGGAKEGASYEGYHEAANGRRINFKAETTDGRRATVSIEGVSYDLTKGAFFLVSTQQTKPIVKQLPIDMTKAPTSQPDLLKFSEATDEIHAFFRKHRTKVLTSPPVPQSK